MLRQTVLLASILLLPHGLYAVEVIVKDAASLRDTLRQLKSGMTLKIAPGDYPGGHHIQDVRQLTVEALDSQQPPHFKGGANAWHFSRCQDLTVRHLRISGQTANGLNLDDGGVSDHATTGITLEHLEISEIGPTGNHDGIKCSGLDRLTIRHCTISGWGGQGIDMVGCHQSLITDCRFIGKSGFSATAGVQTKGGSSEVTIEKCLFVNAGERPLNIGGSTGLSFFRPAGAKYEAKQIVVRDNTIEGGLCAAAFVGVDGATFIGNAIRYPKKWIFRVLQETNAAEFAPCRNVLVTGNTIVFRRDQVHTEINIGGGTQPESFRFEGNHWLAEDHPQLSKPQLPSKEANGTYGKVPAG